MIERLMSDLIELKWLGRVIIISESETLQEKFKVVVGEEKELIKKLKKLFSEFEKSITLEEVRKLYEKHNFQNAFEVEEWSDELSKLLRRELMRVAKRADEIVLRKITRKQYSTEDLILSYLENRVNAISSEFTYSQRRLIAQILKRYIVDEPVGAEELARKLKDTIGLDERSARALENYRVSLELQGIGGSRLRELTERRRQELLFARALRIARTEISYIYNHAQLQRIKIANAEGWFSGQVIKIWVTAHDERLCPECSELDGEIVDLYQRFPNGLDAPPLHVNCRCTLSYKVRRER